MEVTFDLPDLGEGLTEAEILEWKVAEGDTVRLDQEIVEVSTAKAVVVIPSPHAGIVKTLHGAAGDVLEVGSPLITYAVEGAAGAEPAPTEDVEDGEDDRSPNLVGYGAATDKVGRRRRRSTPSAPEPTTPSRRPRTKPPVRKLAKELGVDLAALAPSGDGGIITRDDVLAAANGSTASTAAGSTPAEPASSPARAGELIPIRGVRRNIAERMEASGAIPAAAAWHEMRATGLMALAAELREADPEARITPFAVVLRVVVAALREVPALNAHYTAEGIRRFDEVHLGFAAATDRGLLVPVIRDAHTRSVAELNAELRRLGDAAKDGTIAPTDLIGSTFTVTNFGALGMDGGIPLINAPEVGIMGIGVIADRPTVTKKGKVKAVPSAQVTLSFDHRVSDGAEAAAFLRFVGERLASKGKLLGML
jgi:pyruvate dehydrogenase E2 component (dihydrolipoamide acetyltransferase)